MKVAYLAGDGLKKGNQILRNMERTAINELGKVELYNPWDQEDINNKQNNPTAEMIVKKDTDAILCSEIIIADVDNNSVGTTTEMGQIWGLNYMVERLQTIIEEATDSNEIAIKVKELLVEIPYKEVLWQTTDVRDTNIPEAGHRRSHSINQYLYGLMLSLGGEAKTFNEIINELKLLD
ncbi:nucleoside 2-deoxyribosyltransferase [Cytobacillus horneckiae]|uniref:nucleoside 2-deoxyribosyltransferase n=1 Tax=Cytobacillus horneckiae TaxID=549687 RepID=UPI0034CFB273